MKFTKLLKEKNLTIYQLSKLSNIPYSTLYDIANGKSNIYNSKVHVVLNLSKALNIMVEELLSLEFEDYNKPYEENIPSFLKDSLVQLKIGKRKNNLLMDCYLDELNSSINVAEVENLITKEQASYLRKKYL